LQFKGDIKILLVGIIERTCRKTIIREIPGVAECFSAKDTIKGKDGSSEEVTKVKSRKILQILFSCSWFRKITTNGSNIQGIWQFTKDSDEIIVEQEEIYSNDIYAILKTYGVEMARAAILREIGGVFGAYKIDVDMRHLELIADYMVSLSRRSVSNRDSN
jgi:hypothetical protein